MTNHWIDLKHADVVLVLGANPAENHPISMKWVLEAQKNGGKLITVDPKFTRTGVLSDLYVPIRSGVDIPFFGGMINYMIENNLFFKEYVVNYTNASFLVNPEYGFEDGMFTGYDEETRKYDRATWSFQLASEDKTDVKKDPTLQDPNCVFQLMKKHYSRYDLETVSATSGATVDQLKSVYDLFCSTGNKDSAGTMMYAMGITQHTVGSQNVRIMAMTQLLLGNMGVAGGGINALRGESNVQGSTDFGLLFHNTNGYMETPTSSEGDSTWDGFMERITPAGGFFTNKPKFYTAQQKAWYGDLATAANGWGYEYLPKLTPGKDYSHMAAYEDMAEGVIKGAFLWGTNPVVGGPNATKEAEALTKLDWLVVADLWEHETAAFWTEENGMNPEEVNTEVFFLPACGSYEKEGTVSNSGRWMQYRWQALHPKGESRPDLQILVELGAKLKELYAGDTSPAAKSINALTWYDAHASEAELVDTVAREINGHNLSTGKLIKGFSDMSADDAVLGNFACGNWIYGGFYTEEKGNRSKNRDNVDNTGVDTYLNWSFAWPANRRVLYNRASCDLNGNPLREDKMLIKWGQDPTTGEMKWHGNDIPDFTATKAPSDKGGKDPFIMTVWGRGNLFAAMNDGPFPEHYEPYESPTENVFSSVQFNPASRLPSEEFATKGTVDEFPLIGTTYRVSEHWQSGALTRNQEWLSELVQYMFVEISEELAEEKGIKQNDLVKVASARGEIDAYAMVTKRLKPKTINGKTVHQVGFPWCFGFKGYATGGTANNLTPHIGDANSYIPEYKAFLCDVRKG